MDEIDQDTPASSPSQFEEPGLKMKVSVENKTSSKINGGSGMMIILSMDFFLPKVKNRAMRRLLKACFAILNMATSACFLRNCGVIYKTNNHQKSPQFFKQQHEFLYKQ